MKKNNPLLHEVNKTKGSLKKSWAYVSGSETWQFFLAKLRSDQKFRLLGCSLPWESLENSWTHGWTHPLPPWGVPSWILFCHIPCDSGPHIPKIYPLSPEISLSQQKRVKTLQEIWSSSTECYCFMKGYFKWPHRQVPHLWPNTTPPTPSHQTLQILNSPELSY